MTGANGVVGCVYCQTENAVGVSFCKKCGYPLSASTVSDFKNFEKSIVWRDLVKTFSEVKKELSDEKFQNRNVLSAYPLIYPNMKYAWLRPFGAIWDTVVGTALEKVNFASPSLDIGCGDGMFSSFVCGTRYRNSFNISDSLSFDKKDIFDAFNPGVIESSVIKRPTVQFDFGLDIKESLVHKAMETGAYKNCLVGDGVKLDAVPPNSIRSIWSNVVKNFEDIELSLSNVHRVLKDDGFIVAQLPTPAFLDNLYYYPKYRQETNLEKKGLMWKLTRGEPDYHPRYCTSDEWVNMFENAGFTNVEVAGFVVNKHILKLWDIGLRLFIRDTKHFADTLSGFHALPLVKRGIVSWMIENSVPLLNFERASKDPNDFGFILIKASK